MGVIDLLFTLSKHLEQLHQAVLYALFSRTSLLEELGIPGKSGDPERETQRRLFDISVPMNGGSSVHIELKVNSALRTSQIKRQINSLAPGDELLYVLLGTTRFEWDERRINKVARAHLENGKKSLPRRIDLAQMIHALQTLSYRDPDHRDLTVAYLDLLRQMEASAQEYENRALSSWKGMDWRGFYEAVKKQCAQDGNQKKVSNPRGGFVGFWWHRVPLRTGTDTKGYLQLEEERLCVKVSVPQKSEERTVRKYLMDRVLTAGKQAGLPFGKPARLGRGKTMTVAVLEGEYRAPDAISLLDWDYCMKVLKRAEAVLDDAAS